MVKHFGAFLGRDKLSDRLAGNQETSRPAFFDSVGALLVFLSGLLRIVIAGRTQKEQPARICKCRWCSAGVLLLLITNQTWEPAGQHVPTMPARLEEGRFDGLPVFGLSRSQIMKVAPISNPSGFS